MQTTVKTRWLHRVRGEHSAWI